MQSELYFRPEAVYCEATTLPAEYYNLCRLFLHHSGGEEAVVPIGSMQYQAVIADTEIIFVDWSGRYAVDEDGNGGRLIRIAWQTTHTAERDALHTPVPIEVVFYNKNLDNLHRRLHGEFHQALSKQEKKYLEQESGQTTKVNIIPWRPRQMD